MFFRWVFFLISSGSPNALRAHTGRACGEPDEIGLTPVVAEQDASRRAQPHACDEPVVRQSVNDHDGLHLEVLLHNMGRWRFSRAGGFKALSFSFAPSLLLQQCPMALHA